MAQAGPSPAPTRYSTAANSVRRMRYNFELDSDLSFLTEEHAQNSGMTLAQYLQVHVNEAMRMFLCG